MVNKSSWAAMSKNRHVDHWASAAYSDCQNVGYFLWKKIYRPDFCVQDPKTWRY